jgi:hypothetical protein
MWSKSAQYMILKKGFLGGILLKLLPDPNFLFELDVSLMWLNWN